MFQQTIHSIDRPGVVPLVGMLSNPRATRNRRQMPLIRRLAAEAPNLIHVELDSFDRLGPALADMAAAGVSVVVVNGGDGTVQAVLTDIVRARPFARPPRLLVLPSGRTNMIANDLGIRGRSDRVLRRFLDRTRTGGGDSGLVERSVLELDLGDGSPVRAGMFFGTAGIVRGIRWCRDRLYARGLPTLLCHPVALAVLIGAAMGFARNRHLVSEPMAIDLGNGTVIQGRQAIVLATTLDRLLLGLRPFAPPDRPGALCFSAIRQSKWAMWSAFRGLARGRFAADADAGVSVSCADEIRLMSTDPVTLDGEIYPVRADRPVLLRRGPRLAFLRP